MNIFLCKNVNNAGDVRMAMICYTYTHMEAIVFKTLGAIGLLLITWGIFIKKEIKQDWIFALGGMCLLAYSISLRDPIFITLQVVFTLASLFEVYKIKTS